MMIVVSVVFSLTAPVRNASFQETIVLSVCAYITHAVRLTLIAFSHGTVYTFVSYGTLLPFVFENRPTNTNQALPRYLDQPGVKSRQMPYVQTRCVDSV